MVLSIASVLAMGLLGVGVVAGIALLIALALASLAVVAVDNAITVLGRLLDTLED
jgi:hypothetical protein